MKSQIYKIALIFALFISLTKTTIANDAIVPDSLWSNANSEYSSGNYEAAIEAYNLIVNAEVESAKLYYNLANAYFKNGDIGKAIINYKRAERLDPMNEDIIYNLAIADAQTVNRIEAVPEFFLVSFYKNVQAMMSSNGWAIFSIGLFAVMLSFVMFYLLSNTPFKRKIGFNVALIALILFIFSATFSVHRKNSIIESNEAVVLSSAQAVKSSPDSNGKDIFIINEGAVVKVVDSVGNWCEIVIASGNRGWIETKAIEVI